MLTVWHVFLSTRVEARWLRFRCGAVQVAPQYVQVAPHFISDCTFVYAFGSGCAALSSGCAVFGSGFAAFSPGCTIFGSDYPAVGSGCTASNCVTYLPYFSREHCWVGYKSQCFVTSAVMATCSHRYHTDAHHTGGRPVLRKTSRCISALP